MSRAPEDIIEKFEILFGADCSTNVTPMPSTAVRREWLAREARRAVLGRRASGVAYVLEKLAWSHLRTGHPMTWQAVKHDLLAVAWWMDREIARLRRQDCRAVDVVHRAPAGDGAA